MVGGCPLLTGGCVQMFSKHCTVPVRLSALTQQVLTVAQNTPITVHLQCRIGSRCWWEWAAGQCMGQAACLSQLLLVHAAQAVGPYAGAAGAAPKGAALW